MTDAVSAFQPRSTIFQPLTSSTPVLASEPCTSAAPFWVEQEEAPRSPAHWQRPTCRSAAPIDAWGFGSSNLFFSRVGDRTFLHDVNPDFSETVIYEVAADGAITPSITAPGYAIVLVQVR